MSYLITLVPSGRHADTIDIADDGTVTSHTGVAKDIGDTLVRSHGVDDARRLLADWSNGYVRSKQI